MIISNEEFDKLRTELSINSKNGLDFILSASVIWMFITFIWTLDYTSYDKSIMTFIIGSLMMPFALILSKVLKTKWVNKENPLQSLGLWLNFAQLFYFPFLIFVLIKMPDYFVMVYVIITGGHFFPYAWFYKTVWFAILAGIIVIGALLLGLTSTSDKMYCIAGFMSVMLMILAMLLYWDVRKKENISLTDNQ